MWNLVLRTLLIVLAVLVGLAILFKVSLWLMGVGPSEVVLKNLDPRRTERITLIHVTESGGEVLAESPPIDLRAGETQEIELDHHGDANLRIRIVDAEGGSRHYTVHEYLCAMMGKTIVIEIDGGQVKRVRSRRRPLADYEDS